MNNPKTVEVNIDWFVKLLKYLDMYETDPTNIDYLIGYIKSAEAIIERGENND